VLSRKYLIPLKELFTSCTCRGGKGVVRILKGARWAEVGRGQAIHTWGPPYTKSTVGCFFPGCRACGL
jgi:hypothetical protein